MIRAGNRFRWAAALMLALVGLVLPGCKKKVKHDLVIVSPHDKQIEAEFDRAFRAWHKEKFGKSVRIDWRDVGGTTSVTRFLLNQYASADSSGIDLYFGGGAPDHKLLAARGILQRVDLPEELLNKLPEAIGGVRQYDPEHRWFGAAVSCFGIIYNARLLKERNLPPPRRWEELASPSMYRLVSAADASQSGSARAAYEMIIQSAPDWPSGWAKLLKIYGNCKRFTGGASDVVNDVANGEVLAGAAIDFYAYKTIVVRGQDIGFSVVPGTPAYTPDPISLLTGAPTPEPANRFIEVVLSERGQPLWCLPAGAAGGPAQHALYRQPVRRDVYEKYKGKMLAPLSDPFVQSGDFKLNQEALEILVSRLLGPLMAAAAIDSRKQLSEAWKVIVDAGQPASLLAEFTSLPADLATEAKALETARKLTDEKQREMITSAWQRFFREKYERIISRAGG